MNALRASPWRSEGGRWIRASGPYVVAQATDSVWYVLRTKGSGGLSGTAQSAHAARVRADRKLLEEGWELEF